MSIGAVRAGRAFVELFANDAKLVAGLKAASAKLKAWGASIGAVGRQMAGIGVAAALPIGMAAKRFADFDDAMRAVQATTQADGAEFEALTAEAARLGRETSFTAVEVGNLMLELGRAGFTATQVQNMTGAVLDLARATGTEAAQAAGFMSSAIRQFGLDAKDAARVADVLTTGANKTFNTVAMLGEALTYAGPVAADFGMTIEDTVAVLGALGNMGIQGSNAGTAMRRMLILTGAEAEKVQQIFGVSAMDANGNARPLVDTMEALANATKNLGTAQRAQKFNELFGLLGITGASVIGKSIGSIRELKQTLLNAGGAAATTAKAMDAGLGGSIRLTISAIEGAAISVGKALAPALQLVGAALMDGLGRFSEWVSENEVVVAVAGTGIVVLTSLGAVLIAVGLSAKLAGLAMSGFAVLMGVASAAVGVLKVSLAALYLLLTPLGLVAGAVIGIGAAFLMASDEGKKAQASMAGSWVGIKDTATAAWGGIVEAVKSGDLALAGQIAFLGLRIAWMHVVAAIQDVWAGLGGWFLGIWDKITGGIASMFNEIWAGLRTAWVNTVAFLANVWHGLVGILKKAWVEVVFQIQRAGVLALQATGTLPKKVTEAALKGLEIERDADHDKIDDETARRKKAVRDALNDKLEGIEADRKGIGDVLREEMDAAEKARRRKRDLALKEAGDEIAIERGKLDDLLAKARGKKADQAEQAKKAGLAGGADGGLGPLVGKAGTSSGTFTAAGIAALGGGGPINRLVQIQEAALAEQKQILFALRGAGLILG